MISNAEKLYNLIANDPKKKQSLFLMALTNPKSALQKICDMGKELNEVGEVLAVGPGKHTHSGEFLKTTINVGDRVVLPTMGFTKLQFDGEEYYVGPENQILAKVKVPVEDVLAETKVTEEDKENLTDI